MANRTASGFTSNAEEKLVPVRKTGTRPSPAAADIELSGVEDFPAAMKRIEAWYECAVLDRPPVRFAAHNAQYDILEKIDRTPEQWKKLWFDSERVVDDFLKSISGRRYLGETFPVFWPNIGPDAYAAFYGCELTYGEVTSWSKPIIKKREDIDRLKLDMYNEYYRKIVELTACALEKCRGKFLVGYTDLHPGMDCVLAWRGMEQLCFDLIESPELVIRMVEIAGKDFKFIFDHFNAVLKKNGQLSISWLEIPSTGKFHIPSCDFATMMSPQQFERFALPSIIKEVKCATHNVFHLDGKGVAKNIDALLDIPEITAIQWAQGVGDDLPIMQWTPLIKRIQNAGKGIIVDLQKSELEDFIEQMQPEGIFLWIAENDESEQHKIIRRLEKW